MKSSAAAALVGRPSATSSATRRSVGVSAFAGGARPTDSCELRPCHRSAQIWAPNASKAARDAARASRLSASALRGAGPPRARVPCGPVRKASGPIVLHECPRASRARSGSPAWRPGGRGSGQRQRARRCGRPPLPVVRNGRAVTFRFLEPIERDQGLDFVGTNRTTPGSVRRLPSARQAGPGAMASAAFPRQSSRNPSTETPIIVPSGARLACEAEPPPSPLLGLRPPAPGGPALSPRDTAMTARCG